MFALVYVFEHFRLWPIACVPVEKHYKWWGQQETKSRERGVRVSVSSLKLYLLTSSSRYELEGKGIQSPNYNSINYFNYWLVWRLG